MGLYFWTDKKINKNDTIKLDKCCGGLSVCNNLNNNKSNFVFLKDLLLSGRNRMSCAASQSPIKYFLPNSNELMTNDE